MGVALIALVIFKLIARNGSAVTVSVDGEEKYTYSLSDSIETVIKTDSGTNVLVIEGGEAFVREADCPDGICVDHRPISVVGETIVCLPHKLVVEIKGD